MREEQFEQHLLRDPEIKSKEKAVRSRLSKARMIENHLNTSLDYVVSDDNKMYETLLKIKEDLNDNNGSISNALRKYYYFANGKAFPTISNYEKAYKR